MTIAMTPPFPNLLAGKTEKGSNKQPGLRLRKTLLTTLQRGAGDKQTERRVKRYVRMLSEAYSRTATNKLKIRFRDAVHNDDMIALCSLSLAIERKQLLSFAPYQEGTLNGANIQWLKELSSFLVHSNNMRPGTKEWCQQFTQLLDTRSPCLGSSLQLIDEMQWHYYLATWHPYQQAVEYDRYNLQIHDPRLCLLACWIYDVPVYLD